jgi:hypothetical protein
MIASPVVALSTAANKQRNPSVPSALNHRYQLIVLPPLQGGGMREVIAKRIIDYGAARRLRQEETRQGAARFLVADYRI